MYEAVGITIYSEFDYIVRAFKFVASMFSSSGGYMGLYVAIGTAAITLGAFYAVSQSATTGKSTILSYGISMLVASILISLITSPLMRTTVIIEDVVANKHAIVSDVPLVLAKFAEIQNNIEVAMIEQIKTNMQPIIPYDNIGKGQGYDLLASYQGVGELFFNLQPYTFNSMSNYWTNCAVPDIEMGWINQNNLYSTTDIWKEIQSYTASRSTIVFDEAGGESTIACNAAYTTISAQMTELRLTSTLESKCESLYGDTGVSSTGNAAAVASCVSSVKKILETNVGSNLSANDYLRSYLTAYIAASEGGALTTMLGDMNKKNASQAFMAEKSIPRLQGMMYGIMIGIFPFLVAFLWISPSKTLSYYLGMFIMMILWRTIDTFMDMQYQNEVHNMFAMMRETGLGLRQMFDIPNTAADAVSLYGQGRWMSMGLAIAISSALTKANGFAMSQMGSQLAGAAQGAATSGAANMDSAGRGKMMEEAGKNMGYTNLANMEAVPNANFVEGIGNDLSQKLQTNAAQGNILNKEYGGDNTQAAQIMAEQKAGSTTGTHNMAQALGMTDKAYEEFQKGDRIINQDIADALVANGMSEEVANSMIGLRLDKVGLDQDGNLTNVSASGNTDDGFRTVSSSENTLMNQDNKGATTTTKYDNDGNVTQTTINGNGFHNFTQNADGTTYGTHTYKDENGVQVTDTYKGTEMTRNFTDSNGNVVEERYNSGNLAESKTILGEDVQMGNVTLDKGGVITSTNGLSTYTGSITTNDGRTFKGSATFDNDGNVIQTTGDKGQVFNEKDIDNVTKENMNITSVGRQDNQYDETNIKEGTNVTGYTASNNIIEKGISNYDWSDENFVESFAQNQTQYLNSISADSSKDSIGEQQNLDVKGNLNASAGLQLAGTGAKGSLDVGVSANLNHSSSNDSTVDRNRAAVDNVIEQLATERNSGAFNDEYGNHNKELEDARGRELFGSLADSVKANQDRVDGPGNLANKVVNAVSDAVDKIPGMDKDMTTFDNYQSDMVTDPNLPKSK